MEHWEALKENGYRFVYDDTLFRPGTDSFLLSSLPKLKAVQWVFGVGQPGPDAWLDVYGKILAAGKQIMICDGILSGSYEKVRSSLGKSPYGGIWIQKDALDVAKRLLDLG